VNWSNFMLSSSEVWLGCYGVFKTFYAGQQAHGFDRAQLV
jgi:hypothetical protein